MEEILYKTLVKSWQKLPTSTGEYTGFLNHQQYHWNFGTISKKEPRWWFQIFFIFIPIWKWSNLTSIFFKWVGSTTNQEHVPFFVGEQIVQKPLQDLQGEYIDVKSRSFGVSGRRRCPMSSDAGHWWPENLIPAFCFGGEGGSSENMVWGSLRWVKTYPLYLWMKQRTSICFGL